MNLIYEIYHKLRSQEKRKVKHTFKHASFAYEKAGKLFSLVTRYEEREEAFYSQKLYGKAPDNTFRVCKSRLKRMLENVLLEDKSLTGYESDAINAELQARKKLLQGYILLGRGAYANSKNLLQQVISTARKYDLPEEWFQAEFLLSRNQSIKSSVREFEKQTEQLLELNRIRSEVNEAQILHYSIKNLLSSRTLNADALDEVRKKTDRIAQIAESTQHPAARYVHYLSEIYYAQVNEQQEDALKFCEKYLELIQHTPSQHSSQRIAIAYVHLVQVTLKLGRLNEARAYSEEVLQRYAPEEINYLRGLELAFLVDYYDKQYEQAEKWIQQAGKHPQFEASKLISANWHYFEACLLFRQKKYQAAYQKLNDTTPLLADKHGMNIYLRILEIMLLFELSHLDLLDTKILNMRQFVKRTRKTKVENRSESLVKLLMTWYKQEYDFATLDEVLPSAEPLKAYSSTELIRFESWLQEKRHDQF
jgi:tetratricopeptide (TPR) repeat protein